MFALCLLAIFGCEPNTVYSHYCHIGSEGWNRADTLKFETDTLRHDGKYSFQLALRTTRRFPYQKVAVAVERTVYRHKEKVLHKRERAVCTIATEEGNYIGTGVGLLQYECALCPLQLNTGDSISLRITHYMDTIVLHEMRDVGLFIAQASSL